VELQNVDSLEGIAVGDTVDIDYVIRDDNRVAKVISIEKISEKEE